MGKYLLLILSISLCTINFTTLSYAEKSIVNNFKHGSYFNSGSVYGGEIADGLDVKNVRWADRGNFERLVFDIYKWGGPTNPEGILPNEYSGTFKFEFINETEVVAVFDGYRAFTAKFPEFAKSDLVEDMQINTDEENAGDSRFKININFKQPVQIEVFELFSPARIVVDIIKIDKEQE